MFKAFKYRIYPTSYQCTLIDKHIGCARFIYNLSLETKNMAYSGTKTYLSAFDISKQLSSLKSEYTWLKDVNSQTLQIAIQNMDKAFSNFYKGLSEYPRFKKKSSSGSFNIPQNIKLSDNKIIFPKFKAGIYIVLHRPIAGIIKNLTISKNATGKYFASILCEIEPLSVFNKCTNDSIGIDLGLKHFLITSDGFYVGNPKYLRISLKKLKYLQRKSSKKKGIRVKHKISLLHEKISNQRKDFLHKTSATLIRENQTICVETLKVSNMVKNHNLSLSISDAGWGMFVSMLEYKSNWYGNTLLQIGTFEPSSKTCSGCGNIKSILKLSERIYNCRSCGLSIDRDVNAAINIKNIALRNYLSGTDRKNQVELPVLAGALTLEANNGSSPQ